MLVDVYGCDGEVMLTEQIKSNAHSRISDYVRERRLFVMNNKYVISCDDEPNKTSTVGCRIDGR